MCNFDQAFSNGDYVATMTTFLIVVNKCHSVFFVLSSKSTCFDLVWIC